MQNALAGAMDHSDISFQDIVHGLGLGNVKRSHTPVFQVNREIRNLHFIVYFFMFLYIVLSSWFSRRNFCWENKKIKILPTTFFFFFFYCR